MSFVQETSMRVGRLLLILALVMALAGAAFAAKPAPVPKKSPAAKPASAVKPLRVVLCGNPPFAENLANGKLDGLSLRFWHGIASQLGLKYSTTYLESIEDAVDQVARGDADVAVGPIGVTSARARITEFTLPYYTTNLAIVSKRESRNWMEKFEVVCKAIFVFFIIMLGVLFVVGNIIWLVERQRNEQHFSGSYLSGVANGMWLALVTMTTVGYGDTVPVTPMGRLLLGVWMFVAMLFGSTLTASLATYLTHYQMTHDGFGTAQDLAGHRVAVLSRSRSLEVASHATAIPIMEENMDDAIAALEEGKVDAVLFHQPEVLYWAQHHPKFDFRVSPIADVFVNYGFVFPRNSPLTPRVDEAMLLLQENGTLAKIEAQWLGDLSKRLRTRN